MPIRVHARTRRRDRSRWFRPSRRLRVRGAVLRLARPGGELDAPSGSVKRPRAVPARVRLAPLQSVHGDERHQLERVHAALAHVLAQPQRVDAVLGRAFEVLARANRRFLARRRHLAHLRRPRAAEQTVDARRQLASAFKSAAASALSSSPSSARSSARTSARSSARIFKRASSRSSARTAERIADSVSALRARAARGETFSSRSNAMARCACATEVAA